MTYANVNSLVVVLVGWLCAGKALTVGVGLAALLIVGAVAMTVSVPRG